MNGWQITQRRLFYASLSQQFDMHIFRLSKRFEDWSLSDSDFQLNLRSIEKDRWSSE